MDVYLSPHSDDICFSLGALVSKRQAGTLLIVYSISQYHPEPADRPVLPPDIVTRTRIAEDHAFAAACGLDVRFLDFEDAAFMGRRVVDLTWAGENAKRIEATLMRALLQLASKRIPGERSWLFCPSGIGAHVDHVAISSVVARNLGQLAALYRIGFYEDLPYASDPKKRSEGLARLVEQLRGHTLRRLSLPIGDAVGRKLALIGLYRSQCGMHASAERFTPAAETESTPHEAIWIHEPIEPDGSLSDTTGSTSGI